MYEQRQFVIFDVTELPTIDFTQVLETSADTTRRSVDGTKTFVKWDGETAPPCVEGLTTKSEYHTYTEMLGILSGPEWSTPEEDIV
jgi:hypothetical protein